MTDFNITDRIIGEYSDGSEGPTIFCIGGLHGNEPAGVSALTQVLNYLHSEKPPFRGKVVGVIGNTIALQKGVRFINQDLNRIWCPEDVESLLSGGIDKRPSDNEEIQRKELLEIIFEYCAYSKLPVYFLDLHTTSSSGSPFITLSDTLRNRSFSLNFPVPKILGIEERLDSTLLNYINELGYIAIGFEAGRHQDPSSVENSIAALWITLNSAGCIEKKDIPQFERQYIKLKSAAGDVDGFYEVSYRHGIENDSSFSMEPGFKNFQNIKKGELLAKSGELEIRSDWDGRIFMPLYQKQGNDGFFVVKRINPFWLGTSYHLRKLGADSLLSSLPGIERKSDLSETLIVDEKIAKWYVIEILHLLGYRRTTHRGGKLIVSKRKFDTHSPDDYSIKRQK